MTTTLYLPELLMSIHGVRTHGHWQKEIPAVFFNDVAAVDTFDYGYYDWWRFLSCRSNWSMVDKFYSWYENSVARHHNVDLGTYDKLPSAIAHSFGTWIVGMAMMKHADIRFDKLVFAGSVLPRDFAWGALIARDQIGAVYNECGTKDIWPVVAARLVTGTGSAGRLGFNWYGSVVRNQHLDEFGHSDFQSRQHMVTHWKEFLTSPPVPYSVRQGKQFETESDFRDVLDYLGSVLDEQFYGQLEGYSETKVTLTQSVDWGSVNPDIYTFLMDRRIGQPAGYITAMPVEDSLYETLKTGKLTDDLVRAEDVAPYVDGKPVKIYLMSIGVERTSRRWGDGLYDVTYVKLVAALIEQLVGYAKFRNIVVTHILAVAWTSAGRQMCQDFGMSKIGEHKFGHGIYELDVRLRMRDPAFKPAPILRRLFDAYRRRRSGRSDLMRGLRTASTR
jgi:GNAT superfamily N-acetyltransferase